MSNMYARALIGALVEFKSQPFKSHHPFTHHLKTQITSLVCACHHAQKTLLLEKKQLPSKQQVHKNTRSLVEAKPLEHARVMLES